jgi:hypothetical protein
MQSAEEEMPRRIDYDANMTAPRNQVPGFGVHYTPELLGSTIEDARRAVPVV